MKPRHGAASTLVMTAAGLIGLGLAGLSVVTGVTPCSLMSGSCSTETAEVTTASLAADTGSCDSAAKAETVATSEVATSEKDCADKTACDEAPKAVTVAAGGDCQKASSCDDAAKAVTVADAGDCATESACDETAKATTVAAAGDCATKSDCGDKAKAVTVAAEGACDSAKSCEGESVQLVAGSTENCSEKTACEDGAKAVTVAAGGDCQKTCDDAAKAQTVAADGSCEKSCEGEAVKAVAASNGGEACGGECAEGDVKALPVAIHAFNDNCPYSGNPAKADVVADYDGMKVNFCCNGCKTRFDKADDAKRLELVSGVVKPINGECCGKPAEAETMAVVQGFPVAFCKSACGEMVKNADAEKQMAFVSSKIEPVNETCCGKPAAEATMVGFHNGQALALCGEKCAERFNNATDEQKSAHLAKLVSEKKAGANCGEGCEKACCVGA